MDIRGAVLARGMEQCRVEEHGVALFHRALNEVLLERLGKIGPAIRRISGAVELGKRQKFRRTGFDPHVDMCQPSLERHERRQVMHMGGIASHGFGRLEPKVVIPVRPLWLSTRMHKVHLRRHLVVWPKPCLGGGIHRGRREIANV